MSIPLLGSPAPPPNYEDLINGNNRRFTSSLGSWINSGGTLSRQATGGFVDNGPRLQLVTTAANQYARLPLPGVFKAGERYDFVLVMKLAESPATVSWRVRFGLDGVDNLNIESTQVGTMQPGGNKYRMVVGTWIPTADRSGVTLTLYRVGLEAGTQTWSIGYARAARVPSGGLGLWAFRYEGDASNRLRGQVAIYNETNGHIVLADNYLQLMPNGDGGALYYDGAYVALHAKHAPGSRTGNGVNLQAGDDAIGILLAERNATTLEVFPDWGDYDVVLLDGSTPADTRHWSHETADGGRSRLGAWFEQVLRVPGALGVATNVAEYWRAPYPMRIDEVAVHAGTAPTGAALVVDVNAGGTTVFTTQANRPSIADGSNDDTSGPADGGATIAKDAVITVDVDQVGSTTPGSDLFVSIRGRYRW